MFLKKYAPALAALALSLSTAAQAGVMTYNIAWSGASLGNSETATGSITLDMPAHDPTWFYMVTDYSKVLALDISTSADPATHYGIADFYSVAFVAEPGMNIHTELVGQASVGGGQWGYYDPAYGIPGDFYVSGNTLTAYWYFQLKDNLTGNVMQLVSFTPVGAQAVPEPSSLALLGLPLAGVLAARRRKPA